MITIRKGHINDLPAMRQLFAETIAAVCKKGYTEEQINVWASGADDVEHWEAIIKNQYVLVAEEVETITGFCTLTKEGYIDLLYVHKDFQRQGIAATLYTAIENYAAGQGIKQLTADVSITAKPFFEKRGFAVLRKQEVIRKGIALTNYRMQNALFNF